MTRLYEKLTKKLKSYESKIGLGIFLILAYILLYYLWLIIWKDNESVRSIGGDIFAIFGHAISIILLFYGYRICKGKERYYWLLLALGTVSYVLGDIIWLYYEINTYLEISNIGWYDFLYLMQVIFYLVATAFIIYKQKGKYLSTQVVFDMLLIMVVAFTFSWHFIISNIIYHNQESILYLIINLMYPVGGLGLLFGTLNIYMYKGSIFANKPKGFLVSGLLVFILTDSLYFYQVTQGTYISGGWIDPLWNLGIFIIAISSVVHGFYQNTEVRKEEKKRYNDEMYYSTKKMQIFLPYVAIIILLIVMITRLNSIDHIVIGSILALILGIIRQVYMILENINLTSLLVKTNSELEVSKKQLEKANEELEKNSLIKEQEARIDFLTNLFNRRFINENLEIIFHEAKKNNKTFSVMLLDIDYFKRINDTLGHEAGDNALVEIANIINENIRPTDILGRFGGEEFIIISPYTNKKQAKKMAERVRKYIEGNVIKLEGNCIDLTVSIGITEAKIEREHESIGDIIARADKALYKAKEKGRNCIAFTR